MSKDQADKLAELEARGWKRVTIQPGGPVGGDIFIVADPSGKMWAVHPDGTLTLKGYSSG